MAGYPSTEYPAISEILDWAYDTEAGGRPFLEQQAGILSPRIDDWRAMVDCVLIDPAYDGQVFRVARADVPERKTDLMEGRYDLLAPEGKTTVAVKIVDMLGEQVVATARV